LDIERESWMLIRASKVVLICAMLVGGVVLKAGPSHALLPPPPGIPLVTYDSINGVCVTQPAIVDDSGETIVDPLMACSGAPNGASPFIPSVTSDTNDGVCAWTYRNSDGSVGGSCTGTLVDISNPTSVDYDEVQGLCVTTGSDSSCTGPLAVATAQWGVSYDPEQGICVSSTEARVCSGPVPNPSIPSVTYDHTNGLCVQAPLGFAPVCTGQISPRDGDPSFFATYDNMDGFCVGTDYTNGTSECSGSPSGAPTAIRGANNADTSTSCSGNCPALSRNISYGVNNPIPIWDGGTGLETQCGGVNTINPTYNETTVGVSWACQNRKHGSSDAWVTDAVRARSCSTCTGTSFGYINNNCVDFGSDKLDIRAKVDGWYVDNAGNRHDMSAVYTGSVFTDCTITGPSSIGSFDPSLRAVLLAQGSVAGSGPSIRCGGSNSSDNGSIDGTGNATLGVSYVCQKAPWGSSSYVNIGTPPAFSVGHEWAGTKYQATSVDCSNLGSGTWAVRAHVDGWWVDDNGTRHDQDAINSVKTLKVAC
jgi:hypothetical protein